MAIFLVIIFISAVLSIVIWSIRNGISPMPTSELAKRRLLQALPTGVEGTVYELGAGWGTLAFPLAKKYPNCTIKAFETSPIPYFFIRLCLWIFPYKNLVIKRLDFFSVPLDDAALIVCYLYPGAMQRLKIKFEKELKADTIIASNTFGIPGWDPEFIYDVNDLYHTKILVYRIH